MLLMQHLDDDLAKENKTIFYDKFNDRYDWVNTTGDPYWEDIQNRTEYLLHHQLETLLTNSHRFRYSDGTPRVGKKEKSHSYIRSSLRTRIWCLPNWRFSCTSLRCKYFSPSPLFHSSDHLKQDFLRRRIVKSNDTATPMPLNFHIAHCIDFLRQHLMCHVDLSMSASPQSVFFTIDPPHKCQDFEAIHQWAERHAWADFLDYFDEHKPDDA